MKIRTQHLTDIALIALGLLFILITFVVNPVTAGVTGVVLWFILLGALMFLGTARIMRRFYPQFENRLLMSFLLSLTVVVAVALSSVQQLSVSDLVLIILIDAVVYYAAIRL